MLVFSNYANPVVAITPKTPGFRKNNFFGIAEISSDCAKRHSRKRPPTLKLRRDSPSKPSLGGRSRASKTPVITQNGLFGNVENPSVIFDWRFGRKFRTSFEVRKPCFSTSEPSSKTVLLHILGTLLFGLRACRSKPFCSMSGNSEPIATKGFAPCIGDTLFGFRFPRRRW